MATWYKSPRIAEVEIKGDEETTLVGQMGPEPFVRLTRETLVEDSSSLVTTLPDKLEMSAPEILVQLHSESRHRRGTSSSSRASSAA